MNQNQEGALEGVLDIIGIAKDTAADAQYHRPVPLNHSREGQLGRLSTTGCKPFQELTVCQLADGPQIEQGSKLPPDGPTWSDRHDSTPVRIV
jgi:hypothetical protein